MKRLKTPLRYPGGKSKAINKMLPYFPDLKDYEEYREPFVGGGSVAIAITKLQPNINIWVNDLYWPLYNFWVQLRDNGDELSETVREWKIQNNNVDDAKKLFNKCKQEMNETDTSYFMKAVMFWTINKCSFSGLTENSTFSKLASEGNFTINCIENLKYYSKLIKNWKITNQSYETLLDGTPRTFVYLDPPYDIKSHLYGKNRSMHKGFDHDLFAQRCIDTSNLHHMTVSYNNDDWVKDRFPNWGQITFPLTYSMNAQSKNYMKAQASRKELLLTNY